jgi:phosphonate transport system permease protein
MFNGSEVCSMLIVFMLLVWLADKISAWLRQGLA